MPIRRTALLVCLASLGWSCSWPSGPSTTGPWPGAGSDAEDAAATGSAAPGEGLAWSELTQRAREQMRRSELVEAEETLAQAAMQVASLPGHSARRRTVFGLQARLAVQLARADETERADALANQLLETAAAEPEIGGAALITLANSVIRRRADAPEPITPADRLRILDILLTTAAAGPVDASRLDQSVEIAQQALQADAPDLARRAIDQAALDARKLHPGDQRLHASIELLRARIALEQGDLATAETSARTAYDGFAETAASAGERGIGEITLARALARTGDLEQARVVADEAAARLEPETSTAAPISDYARRSILAGMAEVEDRAGNETEAERLLREALVIPAVDFEPDRLLLARVRRDLETLGATSATRAENTPPAEAEDTPPAEDQRTPLPEATD